MQFIDTHAHLYLEQFENDIDEVIQRATDAGIIKIILPNIDVESLPTMLALSKRYPELCIPLPGLHPTHVKDDYEAQLAKIAKQLTRHTYKGIGEIGIDLYWDKTYLKQQQIAFEAQLDMALEHDLPVVIHARDSFSEILEIVRDAKYKALKGVFHAFTGDDKLAEEIVSLGFYLGVGGIVTFKNSHLSEVIKKVDLKHILFETDSPYLAPTPHRGKRNESSYVPLIAQHIAQIKGVSLNKVAEISTTNAITLFNL